MHTKVLALIHRHVYFSTFEAKSSLLCAATFAQIVTLTVLIVFVAKAQASPLKAPLLTEEDGTLTIFDAQGREHAFRMQGNGTRKAVTTNSGSLTRLPTHHYLWVDAKGQQHHLSGSRTTAELCVPQQEENKQCNTRDEGEHNFTSIPYTGAYTPVDARPHTCQSYFVEYYGTQRGMEIETALRQHAPYNSMQPTLRTFPVIDFMDEQTLYVVHSRDLGSRTFNSQANPEALLDQLLDDGEQIQTRFIEVLQTRGSISASELGQSTTITLEQLKPVTMQLVIRDGIASPSHWQQIAQARKQLLARHGIKLDVVIIP